jgi:threonine synthase
MNYIGKTPLIRAKNLEKILGVKKIYLKLEGNNPTNTKFDRLANIIVKAAQIKNKKAIIFDGDKRLLRALNFQCEINNLLLLVPKYKKENWKEKIINSDKLLDMAGVKKNDIPTILKNLSLSNQAYLITQDIFNQLLILADEQLSEEIYDRFNGDIDSLFYQSDYPETNLAIQNTFFKKHLSSLKKLPTIYGSGDSVNAKYTEENYTYVNNDILEKAHALLQKEEHLKVKQKDVYPFAAFLKRLEDNSLEEGRHIIILNTARSRVTINQINDFSEISKAKLTETVIKFLDKYQDSYQETIDAIEMAIKDGFILVASRQDNIDGICVVVDLKIDKFIPRYHLGYIGINPDNKGRGLGSELIKEAIDITEGNISLHVDLDNKNAKKLYKKMGFVHKYDRMIYKN